MGCLDAVICSSRMKISYHEFISVMEQFFSHKLVLFGVKNPKLPSHQVTFNMDVVCVAEIRSYVALYVDGM